MLNTLQFYAHIPVIPVYQPKNKALIWQNKPKTKIMDSPNTTQKTGEQHG